MVSYHSLEVPATSPSKTKDPTGSKLFDPWRLIMTVSATTLFALTAWFSASTFSDHPTRQATHLLQSRLELSFSSTVVTLRVLQGLTSALTALAVAQTCENIQWILASRTDGMRLLSFLGLSPSAGLWGAAQMVFRKRHQMQDRAVAGLRYGLIHSFATLWTQSDCFLH